MERITYSQCFDQFQKKLAFFTKSHNIPSNFKYQTINICSFSQICNKNYLNMLRHLEFIQSLIFPSSYEFFLLLQIGVRFYRYFLPKKL
jgi:hypothetical protein